MTKFGSGSLTLTGTSTYTGPTSVSAGSLIVNGSIASSTASLAVGAVLGGDGTIGGVINSGAVAPGAVATPSTLSVGNLTLGPGSLVLDLSSAASDSVSTTGSSVSISGAVLSLNVGVITPGEIFTILTAPANTVQGTFANLPSSGSSFLVGAVTFTINYAGGSSGDDIILTASSPFPTLVSTVLNGAAAYINSTAVSQQHSMVESIVYSFSSAVSLSTSNFSLTGINGTTSAPNVALMSSPDEYDLALSGVPGLTTSHYDFFRLLGDMDGNGVVNSADFSIFESTFLRGTSDPAYFRSRHDLDSNNKIDSRPTSRNSSRTSCTSLRRTRACCIDARSGRQLLGGSYWIHFPTTAKTPVTFDLPRFQAEWNTTSLKPNNTPHTNTSRRKMGCASTAPRAANRTRGMIASPLDAAVTSELKKRRSIEWIDANRMIRSPSDPIQQSLGSAVTASRKKQEMRSVNLSMRSCSAASAGSSTRIPRSRPSRFCRCRRNRPRPGTPDPAVPRRNDDSKIEKSAGVDLAVAIHVAEESVKIVRARQARHAAQDETGHLQERVFALPVLYSNRRCPEPAHCGSGHLHWTGSQPQRDQENPGFFWPPSR